MCRGVVQEEYQFEPKSQPPTLGCVGKVGGASLGKTESSYKLFIRILNLMPKFTFF